MVGVEHESAISQQFGPSLDAMDRRENLLLRDVPSRLRFAEHTRAERDGLHLSFVVELGEHSTNAQDRCVGENVEFPVEVRVGEVRGARHHLLQLIEGVELLLIKGEATAPFIRSERGQHRNRTVHLRHKLVEELHQSQVPQQLFPCVRRLDA